MRRQRGRAARLAAAENTEESPAQSSAGISRQRVPAQGQPSGDSIWEARALGRRFIQRQRGWWLCRRAPEREGGAFNEAGRGHRRPGLAERGGGRREGCPRPLAGAAHGCGGGAAAGGHLREARAAPSRPPHRRPAVPRQSPSPPVELPRRRGGQVRRGGQQGRPARAEAHHRGPPPGQLARPGGPGWSRPRGRRRAGAAQQLVKVAAAGGARWISNREGRCCWWSCGWTVGKQVVTHRDSGPCGSVT